MRSWLQWLLIRFGLVWIISGALEILTFLILWRVIGYSFVESWWMAMASSWILLPFIPVGIYFVQKKYRR